MSGDPRDGRIIIINEDGLCVDLMTGEVIEGCYLVEGTELYPARRVHTPNDADNGMINKVRDPRARAIERWSGFINGVNDGEERVMEVLVNGVLEVFRKYNAPIHRRQAEDILRLVMGKWRSRSVSILRVLDCVLDVRCNRYLAERRLIKDAISEVLGCSWLVKHYIAQVMREWGVGEVAVDEVYGNYLMLRRWVRKRGGGTSVKILVEMAVMYTAMQVDEEAVRRIRSRNKAYILKKLRSIMGLTIPNKG